MTLHTKLVSLRKQKGLTQMDLAERLNVSRQAVSRWEGGYSVPSTDNLKILSELYSVSLDYLLNDTADDFSEETNDQKQALPMHEKKTGNNISSYLFFGALILMMAIALAFCLMLFSKQKQIQNEIVPMEDMATEIIEGYIADTFQLD